MNFEWIKAGLGIWLAVLAFLLGDFDKVFIGLLALICIDFVTGILKAVHNKELDSEVMFKGGIKKIGIFAVVAAANVADNALGLGIALRGLAIGYYIVNEALSTLENWGSMGLPLPDKIISTLKQLQQNKEAEK